MALVCSTIFSLVLVTTSEHSFFFFNDTATTEIYPLSLHDALPISSSGSTQGSSWSGRPKVWPSCRDRSRSRAVSRSIRSEEHTSELQSLAYLVCRLLLEKKKILRGVPRVFTRQHLRRWSSLSSCLP